MTPFFAIYWTLLAFFFGACVGSFLNVCIYRIPRNESVVHPRSHCPNCGHMIAWYDNIPLFSYVALRAKCRKCGIGITPRYFLVELLTAVLFLLVWNRYGFVVSPPHYELVPIYWLVLSGLILGTFVDFEHLIIPDRVTIGGMIAGVVLSTVAPALHDATGWWPGLQQALLGLVAGFGSLFLVAELGKLAFGRKRVTPPEPQALSFGAGRDAEPGPLLLGDDEWPWEELFARRSDTWVFDCATVSLGERTLGPMTIRLRPDGVEIGDEKRPLADLPALRARVQTYVMPREAMGFGDVKLMGAMGAFCGWPAILFIIMVSSVIGSLVGISLIVFRKLAWQSRIPYGPYLALACVLWLLGGKDWWMGYWGWLMGTP